MTQRASLNTRDIYQCLRNAALGVHPLEVCARHADSLVDVSIQGWRLTLALDAEGLAHCVHCHTPGGQQAGLEDWQRYGTNPVDLLSLWERTQLEKLLAP
ncbi:MULTISPECIES: hypothetical protein [unclassified Pseudomonas]|uniref:DUF7693 family protein n=1 Tax=Pseudomonas TaxID=286 RepID=UPI000D9AFE6A|nr:MULTISPECIES: hypothetical protein [unclassified Pseudomonas]PYG78546.1 hypothetical protein N428_02965 [Pseudomonas sp. RV120224-01c]PYG82512.1 hypothetical protein N436_02504 [Pseudomonas sp. RV120224-01b]